MVYQRVDPVSDHHFWCPGLDLHVLSGLGAGCEAVGRAEGTRLQALRHVLAEPSKHQDSRNMYTHTYIYIYVCVYLYIYMCVCVYLYIYICVCVCIYIYICVCIYIYIYNVWIVDHIPTGRYYSIRIVGIFCETSE